MDNKLEILENEQDIDNKQNATNNSLITYEDKTPAIVEENKNEEATTNEPEAVPYKISSSLGIVSFVFSMFSLCAVMIMGLPTMVSIVLSILNIITVPFTPIIPLFLFVSSITVVALFFLVTMPASIIGLILGSVEEKKLSEHSVIGEFAFTISKISLFVSLACLVVVAIIYIVPLIVSLFFEAARFAVIIAFFVDLFKLIFN